MIQNFLSNINIHLLYGTKTACGENWKGIDQVCAYHKLYYIVSGKCIIEVNGEKYEGAKGRLFFIPAHTKHSFYHEGTDFITKYWMHFNFEANSGNPFKDMVLPPFVTVEHPRIMEKNFQTAFKTAENLSQLLIQKAKIMEILSEFMRLTKGETIQTADPVEKTLEYIKSNLGDNITVKQLADIAHLHPNYYIRTFKQLTGMPPIRYVTIVKMEEAKSLLERTATPVSDISASLGYKDPAHFTKVFKSVCGYSPKQFRERFSIT